MNIGDRDVGGDYSTHGSFEASNQCSKDPMLAMPLYIIEDA